MLARCEGDLKLHIVDELSVGGLCGEPADIECQPSALYTMCGACVALREEPPRAAHTGRRGMAARRRRRYLLRRALDRRERRADVAAR